MPNLAELKSLTLLYVEDNEEVAQVSTMVLKEYIERVFVAKNGIEALEIFNTHSIDLILSDILMPKMNGIDFARKIRQSKHNSQCPIIFTTAHTEVNYLLEAISLNIDGYVLKPINLSELLSTMHKAVLPRIQAKEIESKNMLLSAINTFVGGKKIEIIRFLLEHRDDEGVFYGSYEYIMEELGVSKPTIVKTFHQLMEVGLLIKIRNKVYKICIEK